MDAFTKDDVRSLLDHESGWCVSLFLPTERAGHQTEQNPIRLKNLLQRAEDDLIAQGVRRPEAVALLAEANAYLSDAHFWRSQSDGLAVFVSPTVTQVYRVPLHLNESVTVGKSFRLRPLLPFLAGDGRFYLLALSQKSVRLLEGSRDSIEEVEVDALPASLQEALRLDTVQRDLQWHTVSSPGRGSGTGGRPSVFHGSGGPEEQAKVRILRYFHLLDKGLRDVLAGQNVPLVLAGVDYLFPIYRDANTYPHLLEKGVTGHPEDLSLKDLHQRAWGLVEPHFSRAREEAWAKYETLAGTGLASADPREVVSAARFGRVESLFFALGCHIWGTFDTETGTASLAEEPGPDIQDLSDLAALHTILNQGAAYPAAGDTVSESCLLAAVFRY
ncbi:MAG: hypothetical protein GXX93_12750 [Anaerolineae bacterium]|nr:hypothetical protein [Anaerolineae bacterium]